MMRRMAELITERIAPWKEVPILQEIFQSRDPEVVARAVYAFCEVELGQQPTEALFFFASVGVVFGFRMSDGQRLVIKVHRPECSSSFLAQMGKVQQYLAAQGYPCPRPVAAPRPLVSGIATIDELIDEGIPRDAHEPVIRHTLAVALFQHIHLLRNSERVDIDLTPFDLSLPSNVLWPRPHNALFDFKATQKGAEWIDILAWKVKRVLEQDDEITSVSETPEEVVVRVTSHRPSSPCPLLRDAFFGSPQLLPQETTRPALRRSVYSPAAHGQKVLLPLGRLPTQGFY